MTNQNQMEGVTTPETQKGHNVEIVLKLMRHGERGRDNQLLDKGRDDTKERAQTSEILSEDFDAIKAIGSNVDKSPETGMGRALETAHIYAHEIAGDEAFVSRMNDKLNYESIITKAPYDHAAISKANLPENFDSLSADDKAVAMKKAQTAIVNYLFSLQTPEAEQFKKEVAGSYATIILHYKEMTRRLNNESKVLIPAGTHGPMIEFLLQYALVKKDEVGNEVVGFDKISEIGGQFNPSDSVNIDIATDDQGNLKPVKVSFDDKNRPQVEMHLDMGKLTELAAFYDELHRKNYDIKQNTEKSLTTQKAQLNFENFTTADDHKKMIRADLTGVEIPLNLALKKTNPMFSMTEEDFLTKEVESELSAEGYKKNRKGVWIK